MDDTINRLDDTISRRAAIGIVLEYDRRLCEHIGTPEDNERYAFGRGLLLSIERNLKQLPPVQPTQDDEAAFWKKRAREYEEKITGLVAEQAREVKIDLIQITEEGIIFKKAQQERKTGRWERHYSRPGVYADLAWHCSECGSAFGDAWANKWHYCPNCGAKMEEGEE